MVSARKPVSEKSKPVVRTQAERDAAIFAGWRFDERSGSVLGPTDSDGDDLVIFKARNDSRGSTYSVLSASEERRALQLAAAAPALLAAAVEFCRKVDAGEARSTKSYAAFAAAIEKFTGAQS